MLHSVNYGLTAKYATVIQDTAVKAVSDDSFSDVIFYLSTVVGDYLKFGSKVGYRVTEV